MKRYLQPGLLPVAQETVDEDGKRHHHIGMRQKELHCYEVPNIECTVVKNSSMLFTIRLDGETFDLQLAIPAHVVGGMFRHLMEHAKNYEIRKDVIQQQ